MTRFLRLKHWQLFCLLFGIPLAFQITMFVVILSMNVNTTAFIMAMLPIVAITVLGTFFGWFYSMGTNLHRLLPEGVEMNLKRFKFFLLFPLIYIALIIIYISFAFFFSNFVSRLSTFIAIIVPLHLFAMFCQFYILYFVAKTLKSVELKRKVTFSDYGGEFMLLWLFFIGVWVIQPRVNKLFDPEVSGDNDVIDRL